MELGQLKPNVILRGALFNEPVQVITVLPLGTSVKVIGTGLKTVWGVLIFIFPVVGPVAYFALRPAGRGHKTLGRPPSI